MTEFYTKALKEILHLKNDDQWDLIDQNINNIKQITNND